MNNEFNDILGIIADEHIADEHAEESERWKIGNMLTADWALDKIKATRGEYANKKSLVEEKILQLEEWLLKEKAKHDKTEGFFTAKLHEYFETAPKNKTKTQETLKLPSGTLRLKYPGPDFVRDDDRLLQWLKERNLQEYIKVKESVEWGNLKKATKTFENVVIDENGEIIEGIKVVPKPPVFEVEV